MFQSQIADFNCDIFNQLQIETWEKMEEELEALISMGSPPSLPEIVELGGGDRSNPQPRGKAQGGGGRKKKGNNKKGASKRKAKAMSRGVCEQVAYRHLFRYRRIFVS